MAVQPSSNTDQTAVTDRQAAGTIPDTSPPSGTTPGGGGGGGGAPSGPAGGDLGGTYPNPILDVHGRSAKATPVDADELPIADSAAGFSLKKLTWLALKTTLRTYFDGLYLKLTGGVLSGVLNMAAHKIQGLANGSLSDDAAAFGQIPTSLPPSGAAGGDLTGSYPNPSLKNTGPGASSAGSTTQAPSLTIDAQGRVTALSNNTISPGVALPSGGAKFARLAKNSTTNFDVGWYAMEHFNVVDYGADPTGAGDSLAAFNAAATALLAAGGGTIFIPAGTYQLSNVWTITQANNHQSVRVLGDGCGVTKLYWPNANAGLEIIGTVAQTEGATTSNVVSVENFSICTGQVGTYKGLRIVGVNTNGSDAGVLVRRLAFEGYTVGKYWGTAVHLVDLPQAVINNISSVSGAYSGDGILLESNSSQTVCHISDTNIQGHQYGLRVIGNGSYEGVTVCNSTFLNDIGVYWNTTSVEEQLNFFDNHIRGESGFLKLVNCVRCFISNNNLLKNDAGTFTGISLNSGCYLSTIENNYLRCGAGDYAISNSAANCFIGGNIIEGPSVAIILNSGSNNGRVVDNQLYAAGSEPTARSTTICTDNGTGNHVQTDGHTAMVYLSSGDVSINDSAETTITWNSARFDELGAFSGGSPTRLTIPAAARWVRMTAGVTWDQNVNGLRRLRIVGSDGNAWGQVLQHGSDFDAQNCMTALLEVKTLGLTYFTVTLTQTSGGALKALNKPNTFFAMEVVQP